MELLDRYLHAVRFWLPKAQQEDIIAELGEDLRSQIEDREAALGRPLDEDGLAAILKERGNPMLVAARYLPQRSLIGPALFPIYQFILKLVILWILPPVFILIVGPATVLSGRDPSLALVQTVWTMLMAAVFAFGVITLIFAAMERYPHESTLKWDPRRLPRVQPAEATNRPQPVPGYMALVELLAGIGASLVWIEVMWLRTSFDFGGVTIALAPVWRSFFWPILLVTLSGVPIGLMGWLRPWWTPCRRRGGWCGRSRPASKRRSRFAGSSLLDDSMNNDCLAELRGVSKRFGKIQALDGLDLQVRPGELLALLGPNGAGKTTAISILLGLQQPDAGEAHLCDRRQAGVMMQEVGLAPELRVREHIDLVASYYPAPLPVAEVMELTHTTAIAHRPYGKLSGGQKRQTQFAMSICGSPKVLFLDEPTVGLDVQSRQLLWDTLAQLVRAGTAIVLTTHYLEEAEALADRA